MELLKSLYERKGYLSAKLISESPSTPNTGVYQHQFKSLYVAYSLVGFEPDRERRRGPGVLGKLAPDEILNRLRDLWDRKGCLNTRLIDHDPITPGCAVIRRVFGSIEAAYGLIGYKIRTRWD